MVAKENPVEIALVDLVDELGELNASRLKIEKEEKAGKTKLKDEMKASDLEELIGSKFKAECKEVVSQSLNPERTLQKLKDLGAEWLIKTVEIVDQEALEESLYKKELDAAEFVSCMDEKSTYKLSFKKVAVKKATTKKVGKK